MTETTTILDLDALLDSTMDNVEDVPDYLDPPTGLYALSVPSVELKPGKPAQGKDKAKPPRIVITYKVEATVSVASDTEVPVPDGSLFSEGFQYSEDGLKYFKKQAKNLLAVDDVAGVSLRDLFSAITEIGVFDAKVTTKETPSSTAPNTTYTNTNVRRIQSATA